MWYTECIHAQAQQRATYTQPHIIKHLSQNAPKTISSSCTYRDTRKSMHILQCYHTSKWHQVIFYVCVTDILHQLQTRGKCVFANDINICKSCWTIPYAFAKHSQPNRIQTIRARICKTFAKLCAFARIRQNVYEIFAPYAHHTHKSLCP